MQKIRRSRSDALIERRRHRAAPPLPVQVRALVLSAASVFLTVILATSAVGSTYALFNSSISTLSATITSGTATMTVSTLTLPPVALYPGLVLAAPVTVTNTGNVPLAVTLSSLVAPTATLTLSDSLTIGLAVVASTAACTSGVNPTWTGTFAAAAPSASVGPTVATAQSQTLCVLVALSANAPSTSQATTASSFAVVLTGVQA